VAVFLWLQTGRSGCESMSSPAPKKCKANGRESLTKLETALSDRQRDEQDRKTLPLSHRLIAEIPVTNIVAAQSMPIPGMQ
jgi:hypothetical protein